MGVRHSVDALLQPHFRVRRASCQLHYAGQRVPDAGGAHRTAPELRARQNGGAEPGQCCRCFGILFRSILTERGLFHILVISDQMDVSKLIELALYVTRKSDKEMML